MITPDQRRQMDEPAQREISERQPSLPPDASPVAAPRSRRWNYFTRHWRGDLPLWVSFWIVSVLGIIPLSVPIFLADTVLTGGDDYPSARHIFLTGFGAALATGLMVLWQLVGTWRSASKYKQTRIRAGRRAVWGNVTYFIVAPAALIGFGVLLIFGYLVIVAIPIVFLNDPELPNYSIRVMRGGTEVEITGGFKFGLTDDFIKVLDASRQIRVVHLDSIGGRSREGARMFRLIWERGLDTYVSAKCSSACTLAFAGGRERFLRQGATLGFHRGGFTGLPEQKSGSRELLDDYVADTYRAAGFDAKFIEKALATPWKDMWRPPVEVLITAGVVTGVADGRQFALSGMGADLDWDDVAETLSNTDGIFPILSRLYPEFEVFVDEYREGVLKGKTEAEALDRVKTRIGPFVAHKMALADDDHLVTYSKLLLEEYVALGNRDATDCFFYASGTLDLVPWLPDDLWRRDDDIRRQLLVTAWNRPPIDESRGAAILEKVRGQLLSAGTRSDDLALLDAKTLDRSKHAAYCDITVEYFRELSKLPAQEIAFAMRSILSAK
jgi:hypothetical protein